MPFQTIRPYPAGRLAPKRLGLDDLAGLPMVRAEVPWITTADLISSRLLPCKGICYFHIVISGLGTTKSRMG